MIQTLSFFVPDINISYNIKLQHPNHHKPVAWLLVYSGLKIFIMIGVLAFLNGFISTRYLTGEISLAVH